MPPRLGKKPPRVDPRTLRLEKYITAVPTPPSRVDWSRGFNINWGMMLNGPSSNPVVPDGVGDCTEAKKGHAIQIWSLMNGRLLTSPDSVVLAAYEKDAGYVPGNPATDTGEVMLDNLNDWRRDGFWNVLLAAYAAVNLTDLSHVATAIWLFGFLDMGFQVPQSAMDQFDAGEPWDVVANDGGIVGGHDVIVPMYDVTTQMFTVITWGKRQLMTVPFFTRYTDEAYALLSPEWLRNGVSPSGFDLATLQADLATVTA